MSSLTTNYSLIKPGVNDPTDEDLWGTYINTNSDSLDTDLKAVSDVADAATVAIAAIDVIPIATVFPYAGATAPSKYALCYGQAISRTTYAALYAIVGDTYGAGDASTTFNLPDLRGRTIAGQDDMGGTSANRLTGQTGGVNGDTLGGVGGAETHTLTVAQMPSHTHTVPTYTSNFSSTSGRVITGASSAGTDPTTSSTGGDAAHNNVQPTIILNYIMKIE